MTCVISIQIIQHVITFYLALCIIYHFCSVEACLLWKCCLGFTDVWNCCDIELTEILATRMHSSGMNTVCLLTLLTISQHALGRVKGVYIPACTGQGVSEQGCLPRGVSEQVRCLPGGVCSEVSVWGCLPRVVCVADSSRDQRQTSPLWTDRYLWKHNLHKFYLQAVINGSNVYTSKTTVQVILWISLLVPWGHVTLQMRNPP